MKKRLLTLCASLILITPSLYAYDKTVNSDTPPTRLEPIFVDFKRAHWVNGSINIKRYDKTKPSDRAGRMVYRKNSIIRKR